MFCRDCSVSLSKICDVHGMNENLHDDADGDWFLFIQLVIALEDCQRADHRHPCGTCIGVLEKAKRRIERRNQP